ncbi:Fic family protein [Arcicella rosea]
MRNFEEKRTSAKWTKIAKYSVDIALRDIQDLMTKKVLQKENVGIN